VSDDGLQLATLLAQAGFGGTVVFTGAGVSTESGIPDFRSPGGVWSRYAPIMYQDYLRDPAQRVESWRRGLESYPDMARAQPNAAHLAIAEWYEAGLISAVVTQNIDGLHQTAGVPASAVVELHGSAHFVECLTCGDRSERLAIHARVEAGEGDPPCLRCGGILKSTTVSFGQPMPAAEVARAESLHQDARLCLVIGSSLVVYPAAALPEVTLDSGGQLAIVNQTETHLDERAVFVSRLAAGVLLAEVAERVRSAV